MLLQLLKDNRSLRQGLHIICTLSLACLTVSASSIIKDKDTILRADALLGNYHSRASLDFMIIDMKDSVNTIWILTSAVNIIAMQLGFTLLEVGSIHPKNKSNILIKNLLDTFIGALAYYSMGYAVANQA